MHSAAIPINESYCPRLQFENNLLDSGAERQLEAMANVVAFTCGTSTSLIRLADMNRQLCISALKPCRDWSYHVYL